MYTTRIHKCLLDTYKVYINIMKKVYSFVHTGIQLKCDQYWSDELNVPFETGRGFTITTTNYKQMTSFESRQIRVEKVR